ncbi:hypothetical protein EIN_383370 [Entamoeba invadens IP1]|uniref:Uncharacterized protein n=1 Tax=Entamoeba invadens IP1 TaxID=370355 RepID=A0A0A1U6V9_ENTIV|nr:hypothetical protein EIN_383370 [Entamoeba invadens IP1]ELP87693.1 hypothetical protein EIN_383370 [Entamoeba invadens IP1]|eukprot:XP_004254464.1 hypothetical protein EIN_383370 [Entamoeba invadens IP1]
MENICVFEMSRSNIAMSMLDGNILTNKKSLTFDDVSEAIPIEKESRELLCVGNKGKACEFEIFVTPHCTLKLHDDMMIVTMNIENSETVSVPIAIEITTENLTKLDYNELKEDKKLGEGFLKLFTKELTEEMLLLSKK